VLFEPAQGRRVVQLTVKRALEDAEMQGGAGRQEAQATYIKTLRLSQVLLFQK